jgi:hypothetical protein
VWSTEAQIVPSQSLMQLLAKGIVTLAVNHCRIHFLNSTWGVGFEEF